MEGTITWVNEVDRTNYVSTIGRLDSSEIAAGQISMQQNRSAKQLPFILHRPLHSVVKDFNKDGTDEILVSELGHLSGKLSLLIRNRDSTFDKRVLLGRPGSYAISQRI